MPFEIVRNDITKMQVDAIVNSANSEPIVGGGADLAIHNAAGVNLIFARSKYGIIEVGNAIITPGFNLPAKYVIHTVGPVWKDGKHNEKKLLRKAYLSSLQLAKNNQIESIAFPFISAGIFGYPREEALEVAISAFKEFLQDNEMLIYLVVFDNQSFQISQARMKDIRQFIDDNYIDENSRMSRSHQSDKKLDRFENIVYSKQFIENPTEENKRSKTVGNLFDIHEYRESGVKKDRKLEDILKHLDDTFVETLFHIIDMKGLSDTEVYKKANIDRRLFSKIRSNKDYQPSKETAIALALALELNLDETKDFLAKAGYALSNSNKFDLIIEYFIGREEYDLFTINSVLFEFKQKLICTEK